MSRIVPSTFTAYEQSEQEQLIAMSMTPETKQFIQTQVARIAEEHLALTPNPNNYNEFIQEEAYKKGQLDFARYLLDCAAEAEARILAAAQDAQS